MFSHDLQDPRIPETKAQNESNSGLPLGPYMPSYASANPFYNILMPIDGSSFPQGLNHELAFTASVDGPSRLSTHMKTNWIRYAYTKRNWVRRLRWERATVCMAPLRMVESVESGSKTYFNERSCSSSSVIKLLKMREWMTPAHQEESICQKGVHEDRPTNPATSSTSGGQNFRRNQSGNDAHKLVS